MAERTMKQIAASQKRSLASIQKRLEALAAEWDEPEAVLHVPGIAISQGEDFVVVPFEAELAEVV